MISKLFKKPTAYELLEELKSLTFKENKVNSMLEQVDINHTDQNQQTFLHSIIIENRIESVRWLLKNKININALDSKGLSALMLASKQGYDDAVKELLNANADVSIENHSGFTAIEFAIYNHHFTIYKQIKPFIKNINRKNKKGQTLLHVAVKAQNFNVIDDLFYDKSFIVDEEILFYKDTFANTNILNTILGRFDNLNKSDNSQKNILFYVVENGIQNSEVFHSLLENGLDINCIDSNGNNILLHLIEIIILKEENLVIDTPEDMEKHKSEIKNLMNMIPVILENEINTLIYNNKDETIISLPTKAKNLEILNLLFEYDTDINIVNSKNENALCLIATKGPEYIEVIYLLLDLGANPNIKDNLQRTVIEKIITANLISRGNKKVKTIEKSEFNLKTDYHAMLESILVNTNTNLTMYNSNDEPYLFEAVRYGELDIVKLLVKYGADINQPDKEGNHIIFKYMKENQVFKKEQEQRDYHNNLQTIVMMGANVNAKDPYGGISLHKAILDCDSTVIKMLFHSGADMNALDNRGRHILHNAIWKNNSKVFKLVYSYNKILLNEPDKFGVMPINYAAFLGYTDLVLEFIDLNAHINNPYRKTQYILNFLKKFHKNLKPLVEQARTKVQKNNLKILVDNMKKEFDITD